MHNPHHVEVNLAISTTRDVAAQFQVKKNEELHVEDLSHLRPRRPHSCVLWGYQKRYVPTEDELADLRLCGCSCDGDDLQWLNEYPIAYIMNVHFRSGEWGNYPRCGSVVTCVLDGQSHYARVDRFLQVDGDECPGYASVTWFSKPQYLLDGKTPLVVRVTGDGSEIDEVYGSIIRITDIDPSRVMVEMNPRDDFYIMMRDSGYDTRPEDVLED